MNFTDISLGLEQYADLGFGILVAAVCLRTLLFDRDANLKQRAIWKHELAELERGLRQLIDEATEASQVFDRQLNNRQVALEKMAERAEMLLRNSISNANKIGTQSKPPAKNSRASRPLLPSFKDDWTVGEDLPSHLSQSIDILEDKTELSNAAQAIKVAQDQKIKNAAMADEKIFSQTSIVDPAAYKIAKRLLLEGKELHVIARKLDIPVSEIRHLETLIRNQAQADQAELPSTFKAREIEPVKKVIRDPAERRAKQRSLMDRMETLPEERSNYGLAFEEESDLPLTLQKL